MESEQLILFKSFNDEALANDLAAILDEHGITYSLEESSASFDPGFRRDELAKEYSVKINASDFEPVNRILNELEISNVETVSADHYLYGFTDAELMEILAKADEWSPFDYQLSRKILTRRGVIINDDLLTNLKNERLEQLKIPDPPQNSWIITGYIFALAGGILGVFIGWHLATYKKTLPNGQKVFGYNEKDRRQGQWIFYISIAVFTISVIYKIAPAFK